MQLDLKYEFLSHETEREDAAKQFVAEFGHNTNKQLVFKISFRDVVDASATAEKYLRSIFTVLKVSCSVENLTKRQGFFRRKVSFQNVDQLIHIAEVAINFDNMLEISSAVYDLILALDARVTVERAV